MRSLLHSASIAALALAIALAPARARAQDGEPTAAEVAAARELFVEGAKAARAARWQDAYEAFERSYALYPQLATLLNLASAQASTGRLVEAAESYRRYLRGAEGEDPEHVAAAERALESLEPRIPHVRVSVPNRQSEDAVELDEGVLREEVLGARYPVEPGEHVLRVRRDGEVVAEETFTAEEGKTVEVSLEPPPPSRPAAASYAEATESVDQALGALSPASNEPGYGGFGLRSGTDEPEPPPPPDGSLELAVLTMAAGIALDDQQRADAVEGGMTGLGLHFRLLRIGKRQPFGFAGVVGALGTVGRWRGLFSGTVAFEAGVSAHLGWPIGATMGVYYTPAFVRAEARRDGSFRAYRVSAGLQLWSWNLGVSYQELGRDADSTYRPLLLTIEAAL